MKNDYAKELMLNIFYCDEIKKALSDNNHPCHKIVQYQSIENPDKLFKHPEPWNGFVERAEILFIGSNPSIDFDEIYPTDYWEKKRFMNFITIDFQLRMTIM